MQSFVYCYYYKTKEKRDMAKLLYSGTHSTDDPTRASFPFISANGAKEAGHDPLITLLGDAVYVMKDSVRDSMHPVGFPPLSEIMAVTVANQTPLYI